MNGNKVAGFRLVWAAQSLVMLRLWHHGGRELLQPGVQVNLKDRLDAVNELCESLALNDSAACPQ